MKLMVPAGMSGGMIIILLIKNYLHVGTIFPSLTVLKGEYFIEPFWFYFTEYHKFIIPFLLPFFYLGDIFTLWFRKESLAALRIMGISILFNFVSRARKGWSIFISDRPGDSRDYIMRTNLISKINV